MQWAGDTSLHNREGEPEVALPHATGNLADSAAGRQARKRFVADPGDREGAQTGRLESLPYEVSHALSPHSTLTRK